MDEQQVSGASGAPVEGSGSSTPMEREVTPTAGPTPSPHGSPSAEPSLSTSGGVAVATKPVVRRGVAFGAAGGALALGLLAGGVGGGLVAAALASSDTDTAATSTIEGAAYAPPTTQEQVPSIVPPSWGEPSTPDESAATAATADQQVGVVTITSTLGYQNAQSAGTGMVLTSDGLVLTNNHVIEGSTSIAVTVESTGQTYVATVVGTDATHDVAVLQLQGAGGVTPVALDDDNGVTTGDDVTAIGNADGTGTLVAAAGAVTATEQTMTASDGSGSGAETLSGLIQFAADVVSGDSGGPLLDDEGEVVGMTTAASTGNGSVVAYAISIEDAVAIAIEIEQGTASADIVLGYPAFLGVALSTDGSLAGVLEGTPAASAGLAAGDTITAIDGAAVSSAADLSAAIASYEPGDTVTVTWTTAAGAAESAQVTLSEGPAA
ncbi:S1C family serine protease [Cellulomonas sp. Root485]|uniref:S1C family serine protease n=1 Tax=Cellulomonas sp. Root485 TaxID=1736546 RepID=UPI000AA961DB|nr:trypsin-like peptidase domain-containing protein [Cellulomonas sp. Root485]